MRSAVVAAAFAVNVLAAPYVKRDEVTVTDVDIVYATDVVTVYATGSAVNNVVEAAPSPAAQTQGHWGHSWTGGNWHSSWQPESTSVYVAPVVPTTTTTPAAAYTPPPAPTTPSSVWEAPVPTTTVAPVVPVTTAAPTTWAPSAGDGDEEATGTTASGNGVTWTADAAYTAYSDVVVLHHNFHRFNHSSQPVVWNETLAKSAQDLADTCDYHHDTDMDGGGYGQNIAAGVDQNSITTIITDLFYNGEVGWFAGLYGQPQPSMDNFEHWGHFSQIVWNETVSVACATSNCTGRGLSGVGDGTSPYFTVCNYFPSGNWANEYGANIGDSKNLPTIGWNAS